MRCLILESDWLACDDPGRMLTHLRSPYTGICHGVSDRRLRLWACACCRGVWPLLTDPRSRRAVEVAEQFADGLATEEERVLAQHDSHAAWDPRDNAAGLAYYTLQYPASVMIQHFTRAGLRDVPPPAAQAALLRCVFGNPFRPATLPGPPCPDCAPGEPEEDCDDCGGTGTVLGPCPWLTPQVVALANAAYLERGGGACGRCGGKWRTVQGWTTVEVGGRWTKCPDCAGEGRVATTGHLDAALLAVLADALEDGGATDAQLLGHLRSNGPHVRGCWAADLVLGKE